MERNSWYDFLFVRWFENLLAGVTILAMFSALYLVFLFAPDERVMGPVQRVMYFHVGCAVSCYLMIGALFIGSLAFLITRQKGWDTFAESAAKVSFTFASAVLASGMIWGHAAWNTWWRWEPRLVSFLILWLILFSYHVLRLVTDRDLRQARQSAVLGLLSAINVPVVVFSIRLLDHREQLHPQVMANQGLTHPGYVLALVAGIFSVSLLSLWFFLLTLRVAYLRELIEEQHRDLNLKAAELRSRLRLAANVR